MVAHLVMDQWAKMFVSTLAINNITVYLFRKYVDDVNLALSLARPGLGWERDPGGTYRLVWSEEREARDLTEGTTPDKDRERTIGLMGEMASLLIPGITFTTDLPSRYHKKKVPMLDLQV